MWICSVLVLPRVVPRPHFGCPARIVRSHCSYLFLDYGFDELVIYKPFLAGMELKESCVRILNCVSFSFIFFSLFNKARVAWIYCNNRRESAARSMNRSSKSALINLISDILIAQCVRLIGMV